MRIVQTEMLINVHVAGRSREFKNTEAGFSNAVKWAFDVIGALLLTFFLIIAVAAEEAL